MLEFCHSAGTPGGYAQYREQISLGFPLEHAPDESLVLDILIAGYAIVNEATVLAADHDFDHIAAVSDLKYEYVAPWP